MRAHASTAGHPDHPSATGAAVVAAVAAAAVAALLLLPTAPPASAAACPASPLAGVQRPHQLGVLDKASPCRTMTGVVRADHREHDGDCHVNVVPDAPFRGLMNAVNRTKAHGVLITEAIPAHRVAIPRAGSRVQITGTWVLDHATGWRELHPVWSIAVLSVGTGTRGTC
jgi:hypothetical protein